jgi:hypothetical protein
VFIIFAVPSLRLRQGSNLIGAMTLLKSQRKYLGTYSAEKSYVERVLSVPADPRDHRSLFQEHLEKTTFPFNKGGLHGLTVVPLVSD